MTCEVLMRKAIALAAQAAGHHDVPVGALVIDEKGKIIARGKNERELRNSPEAHAEVIALKRAARKRGSWNLSGCSLVVTLEPCLMCVGAIVLARISKVFFGASDPKTGALISTYGIGKKNLTNHPFQFQGDICQTECSAQLKAFFASLRARKGST